jgi:eukaryotic-like serine/threonine-protein kinase
MPSFGEFPPVRGTKLDGRFVVEETLGTGGMGVVVAAKHLGLRRLVAVKLLRPDFARSPEVVTRFLREARAAARLRSEHVVTVLDVGTLDTEAPYFVMEYLPGTDLGRLVQKQGPLEIDDVVDYSLQMLEALGEAHRAGIVHRDLKPPNLFLTTREDGSGCIKVLDFGVSKLIGWEVTDDGVVTRQGMALGSPLYMSPEQIRDASRVDARTDIWSLGAVMHELLTGRPPFPYQELPRVIRAICSERYHLPERSDIPDELFEILFQCLRKDRKERFQDVEELAQAFEPLVRSAGAQVSLERILRKRNSAPPPARSTPIPEPSLVSTRPELPSVTPMERDTPPPAPIPKRSPFFVGVRAGVIVGIVWTAFVLGQRFTHDERPPAPAANLVNALPVAAPTPPVAAPPVATVAVTSTPVAPLPRPRPRRTRGPATKTVVPALSPPPMPASDAATGPVGPPRDPFRKLRPLDTENPFVKSR